MSNRKQAPQKRPKRKAGAGSITKRWVRGSLFFTLAVVLVAESVFLFFMISGYYDGASRAIQNQFYTLESQMTLTPTATDEQRLSRLQRTVEEFEEKTRFELMLVDFNGQIVASSTGLLPTQGEVAPDIREALAEGGAGMAQFIGANERGERVMAITAPTPYSARGIVAMRVVTSLTLVDETIRNLVLVSVAILAAIILASIISGIYFIRSIVIPLQKVEASAARIAQGDFGTRVEDNSNDEIGSLCVTINNMAEELSRNERLKNEFISSVSHELRTPLTSIKGWTETVGKLSDPGDPSFRRGIEIISGETDRLYDMVEELLDFSRMQDGLVLKLELLDLAAEVEDAVLLSGQRAASLGIALMNMVPDLPVPVMADKNRMRQVLVNVLDNAIKYSFTGGEVDVAVRQADGRAIVTIMDDGQGIAPDDLQNVRLKFYKGRGALRGSGIGLAVADDLTRAHGGTLEIESELNRGTQVTLTFPLYQKNKTGRLLPEGAAHVEENPV
ncbi:MAG: HAMP domain-containing histidine kinase [Ruminococcaceae bacterium]|nr:HAMP domain-containing histidine kinase [Oscillospiraceae bacterium]